MHAQDRVGVHKDELELGARYSRIGVSWRDERPITAHAAQPLLVSAQDQLALRCGIRTGTPCELDEADGVELALLELIIWRPGGMMNVDKVKQVLASIALDRTVMIIKLRIIAWARIGYSNAVSMGAPCTRADHWVNDQRPLWVLLIEDAQGLHRQ